MRSRGKLMDVPPPKSSGVKLYLCSNPEDSVLERAALRRTVFPKLQRLCRETLGLDFRVIDPFESDDPGRWPDENTRQQLITGCREGSAGPFLLVLVGHQYGSARLPAQVEVSEFQLLLQQSQRAGVRTQELQRVYQRDENIIPPSYCLTAAHTHTHTCCRQEEEEEMKVKEAELMQELQSAVSVCVHEGVMTAERANSYYRSALDKDLRFAVDTRPHRDTRGRCLVYVHKVVNARGEREKRRVQPTSEAAASDERLLSELCDVFLPSLITSTQLLVYTISTECDSRHGYTTARRRGYSESLCQQVYSDLVALIDRGNNPERDQEEQEKQEEQEEQEELCDSMSRLYHISRPEEDEIRVYVQNSEQQLPLVVTGGTCSGKTVLLAHCAQQIKSWLLDSDPVVLTYFCNLSINPTTKHLLSSLCYHITCRYASRCSSEQNLSDVNNLSCNTELVDPNANCESTTSTEYRPNGNCPLSAVKPDIHLSELEEHLSSLLFHLPSTRQPLVLLIDGLDQMKKDFGAQIFQSLPSPLPPNVKVILTISSNRTRVLHQSPAHCGSEAKEESGYVCVRLRSVDRKQCVRMLTSLLSRSGRRVTSGQQALVNRALTSCSLTLYARLLHTHTSLWRSDSDVTESSLPDSVHSSISMLLDHLEQKHSPSVVARAVSYLSLCRTGLAEAELADLLSAEDEWLPESVQEGETRPCNANVLQVDVERLLLDLSGFLIRRTVAGSRVLSWVSRHFKLVVTRRYLGASKVKRLIHVAMARYFGGGGAGDTSQPFVFASSSKDAGRVNMRKVLELPHHLQESEKWEELENGLLLCFGFHQAMIQTGLLGDLVAMLEDVKASSKSGFSRERKVLASILKSCACFLQSSPMQLPTVMETNLLPYLDDFPGLRSFLRQIKQMRRETGSGLGILLCPAPSSVPSVQCLKPDAKTKDVAVAEAAGAEGGIVAEIMDDGTAWVWKSSERDVAKLSLSCEQKELKFSGVKSSGNFILLSTHCGKIFTWDMTDPEMSLQIRETESSREPTKMIEGFVACVGKLFLWWKDESVVSVFDVSGEAVVHLQCPGSVTALVCSSDGLIMFCGQDQGTVSLFDTNTGGLLGTCSNPNHNAVTSMILNESKGEMAFVCTEGHVTVWDVTGKTPRFVKESVTVGKSDDVLNTDHSEEIETLLVCQSKQVTLWHTCDWELWDQFLAPQGGRFTQAVLSRDAHLFLALLDSCPVVLVWKVDTGECVLSLEANNRPHTLLKTPLSLTCVGQDGVLTVWDSGMIDAAGTALKMSCGVKEVLVEGSRGWFYTVDGSEAVWRWSLETGLPCAHFLHGGPVEKLRLSPDNIHLVTLSAGEIYVWQTETGRNILRVSGSKATDILIAPNSNFAVSVSDQTLSRVWKLVNGSIVCSIHLYLSDAQVSPESTFLIGRHRGDLLAASLWSGSISKRFSCVVSSEHVVAFSTLSEHPEFVVVMVASGGVYTWKVTEETVCSHFQLPQMFHCRPKHFQMSCDGSYALLSTEKSSISLLDLSRVRLCSFKAKGPVFKACLDETGRYIAYISEDTTQERSCICSLHRRPVLMVLRLADGERVGSVRLPKDPSTLVMSKQLCVFVGFEDGSVGVYSDSDVMFSGDESVQSKDDLNGQLKRCPFDRDQLDRLPLATANIAWP